MRQKLTSKYLPLHYYQEKFTQLQFSKKPSCQTFSSTSNHIDSYNPPTHEPSPSFNFHRNIIIKKKIPRHPIVTCVMRIATYHLMVGLGKDTKSFTK